jgi:type VI secretion system protein ImpE
MKTPLELYGAGELGQAIKALGEELRSYPLDAKRRTFLFELLCFAGEYDRAEKHLDVLGDQNAKSIPAVLLYRSALHAERTRQEMFLSGSFPVRAASDAVDRPGTWNGHPFEYLGDADDIIGDHIECFIAGSYTWLPTRYIERLEIEPPQNLRDLLWARARLDASPEFRLQELGEVLLPVIAPLSYRSADEAVKLGRVSVWEALPDGSDRLAGQKLLLVDGKEIPLLEVRSVVFASSQSPAEELVDAAP